MTTQDFLSSTFGISIADARNFIMDNFQENLGAIYDICSSYGINNNMIADILATDFEGLTAEIVSNFFDSNGFNGYSLGFENTNDGNPTTGGGLNIAELNNYTNVILYENVSQFFVSELSSDIFYSSTYASASTWNGIRDLGFTTNYADVGIYEVGFMNNTSGISIDVLQLDATNIATLSGYGIDMSEYDMDLNDFNQVTGNYDLIIAF